MNEGSSRTPSKAMDRRMRNRGLAGTERDPEFVAEATEPDYQTALGQIGNDGDITPTGGVALREEASPGTMEQGGVTVPVASPFHSERVQAEVELLRRRPMTLDQDAQRVAALLGDAELGEDFSGVAWASSRGSTDSGIRTRSRTESFCGNT